MRWEYIDGTPPTIECTDTVKCDFHPKVESEMRLKQVNMLKFPMVFDGERKMSHAVDTIMGCSYCGATKLFGVAVSREQWEKIHNGTNESVE
jgi:hypothetical protein